MPIPFTSLLATTRTTFAAVRSLAERAPQQTAHDSGTRPAPESGSAQVQQ
jgi:hypothetical protein